MQKRLESLATISMTQNRRKGRVNLQAVILNFSSRELLRPHEEEATVGEHLANWLVSETVWKGFGLPGIPAILSPLPRSKGNPTLFYFLMPVSLCMCSCSYMNMCMEVRGSSCYVLSIYALSYCVSTHFTHVREAHQVITSEGPRMPYPGLLESSF